VPFKGTVGAVSSVLAGDTALAFGTIAGTVPHAKAGKLVLLGSSFAKRFSQIPDVPPIADTLPGFDMGFYTALFAPAGTPRDLLQRVYAVTAKAFTNPRLKEVYAASAAEPGSMTSAELKSYMAAEVKSWGEVVRKVGLKID
jgi:tripartite-type tricarboxylate transporter receptor subunit TctC